MTKKCIVCKGAVEEVCGKLKGMAIKMVDNKKARFVYVCSDCQKDPRHIEKAKVKGA